MKKEFLYQGKAKRIFQTEEEDEVLVEFKDDVTAFDGRKKGFIENKGYFNCSISSLLFKHLEEKGVNTHFLEQVGPNSMLARKLDIIPLEVVMRNIVAGSLKRRLGQPEGFPLSQPVLELYYKNDEFGDPMINDYHIRVMEWATGEELDRMKELAFRINFELTARFRILGIDLVDLKLEFGRFKGNILLADEISPDTCRFWKQDTGERLDKDRFRQDLGDVSQAYENILKLLKGESN